MMMSDSEKEEALMEAEKERSDFEESEEEEEEEEEDEEVEVESMSVPEVSPLPKPPRSNPFSIDSLLDKKSGTCKEEISPSRTSIPTNTAVPISGVDSMGGGGLGLGFPSPLLLSPHLQGFPFFRLPAPFRLPPTSAAASLVAAAAMSRWPLPGTGVPASLLPPTVPSGSGMGLSPALASTAPSQERRNLNPNKPPPVKKYKCDVCGKAFSRSNTLITHKRIHTGEKPFKCEHCGRAFRQPGNLTRHRLTHTTVKPYICPSCGKAFNRASNLHTHMRTHSNYRPFLCPYCGKGFHQKIDMKIHIYTHTGDRPFRPSFRPLPPRHTPPL